MSAAIWLAIVFEVLAKVSNRISPFLFFALAVRTCHPPSSAISPLTMSKQANRNNYNHNQHGWGSGWRERESSSFSSSTNSPTLRAAGYFACSSNTRWLATTQSSQLDFPQEWSMGQPVVPRWRRTSKFLHERQG